MTDMKPFGELSDAECAAVLRGHLDGKRVQLNCIDGVWHVGFIAPEPLTPDTIDWSHVAPEWKFMARDESGRAYLYEIGPVLKTNQWMTEPYAALAQSHASYRRGTVDWRDSLVRRPS